MYKEKFDGKNVHIFDCDKVRTSIRHIKENEVYIFGFRFTLQYLRCFGCEINALEISYNQSVSKRYGYVHQYINEFCSGSLTQISFVDMPDIAIDRFEKVFNNVREVNIQRGYLGHQLATFI